MVTTPFTPRQPRRSVAPAAARTLRRRAADRARFERLESRAMLAAFTPGNLVIYRVGTGAAALSATIATEVFIDEYGTNGALVQSIAMPTTDSGLNQTFTTAATSSTEGMITRSTDGKFIVATGYDATPGTVSVSGTNSATVARVIGRIAADGTIDTSTTTTAFSATSIRGAASVDGSNFWASGGNTGVVYQALGGSGAGTTVSATVTNLRALGIFSGQLYEATSTGTVVSRMLSVGTGLPTTSETATPLPGLPTSGNYNNFFFADIDGSPGLDTLYLTEDAGSIRKYSLVSGTWTANGTVTAANVRGITGTVSGTTVTLYATSASTLWSVIDASGFNATVTATATTVASATTNTAFRGVAFAPEGGAVVVVPTLAAPTATAVTTVTATLNGNVTDAGGAQVTARGFVYSITSQNSDPTIGGSNVINAASGTGPGVFSANVASLAPGTQYTVKAYATNSAGTAYSSSITFTTNSVTTAPVLASTPTSSAILDIQALLGGTVDSDGGSAVTERGIVISLSSANLTPTIGGAGVTKVLATLGTGTGTFTTLVEGLAASSVYSFRAYATNSVGTSYSDVASLNTAVAATAPVITNPTKTSIASTTATLGGQITGDGGRPVTERGVVYSKTSENADPVIDGVGVTKVLAATASIGTFTVAVTGLQLLTGYSFKAYATNSAGTSYTTLDTFTTYDTPTTLTTGDVAFTGFDPAGADKLSFVLLKTVVAGTTLALTDNSWSGSALATNEGTNTITFTNAFSAGTLFDYDGTRTSGAKWQWGANAGTGSTVGLSEVLGNGGMSFAGGGDNVFAYQGSAPTSGSASNWVAGFASLAWITTGTLTTGNSYLPAGLTTGDTAFSLNYAVGATPQSGELILLDPNPLTGTPTAIRTTVYTASNWQSDVTTFPLGTTFTVSSGSASIGTTGSFGVLSTTYGTASGSSSITVSGTGLTGDITATAPAGFQVSSDGTTFGSTATFIQSGGSASGTLYVRIPATTGAGTPSGNVVLSATGATSVNAAIPAGTVAKKALVVTADDKTREWDQPNAFTATITGFVNGESASALTGSPSLTSTATQSSAPGTYSIVAALGTLASDNYSFPTFNNGTLTVTIATVTFNVPLGDSVTDTTVRTGYTRIVKQGAGTLTLNQANSYVSGTVVDGGTLIVANGDALGAGSTTVNSTGTLQVGGGVTVKTQTVTIAGGTLAAAGATLLVNATTGIGTLAITSGSVTGSPSLTVNGNGVVTLPTDRRQVVALTALSIDQAAGGGRIDIGKGRIDVAIGGITETDLRADVVAGRNFGPFNGTNGIMTTGGTAGAAALPVVGYRVLASGAAIVAWSGFGDSNLDGQVNLTDVGLINNGGKFNQGVSTGATWSQGDYNYSGGVNLTDINLLNNGGLYGTGSYLPVTPAVAQSTATTTTGSTGVSQDAWIAYAIDAEIQKTTKR